MNVKYIWSNFGLLKSHREDEKYLYIINDKKEERKISLAKYAPSIAKIRNKIDVATGYPIQIRTSQNTGNWNTDIWFSDLSISDTAVDDAGNDTSEETLEELRAKIKFLEALIEQLEEEYAGLTQVEKDDAEKWAQILKEKNIIGDTLHFRCVKHAARTLALRMGIINEGRIWLNVLHQIRRNIFMVRMDDFGDKKAIMALGFDKETLFVATVEWPHPEYRNACISLGINETQLKQDKTYSLEDLARTFSRVDKKIKEKNLTAND